MKTRDAILLVGCGELGGIVLEYLCRVPNIGPIVVADINEEAAFKKVNSAVHGASFIGLYPDIKPAKIDLLDKSAAAELIAKVDPCVIFNGTTMQSWWVVNEIPQELNARVYRPEVGLGGWAPMHLALTAKLMEAVKAAGVDAKVVNSSFPDGVNVSLSKAGMGPTIGVGNGCLVIPYIKKAAAALLAIPMRNINVELIAHHFHCYNWARSGTGYEAPHYLRVYDGNSDITDALGDMKTFISRLPEFGARPGGRAGQYLVASSCMRNILDIYFDTNALGMSPGPLGLEGAYPVRLSRKGAELALPKGVTKEEARNMMLAAQKFDGIDHIADNGDIHLTEGALAMYREELNIDWSVITIKDSYDQALELRKKFIEFLEKNGAALPK